MMAVESLLLTSSSLLILLLQLLLFQTSLAKPHNCTPSACGIFPNISSPLRLKRDPKHCGDFELACENNVTAFYFNSHKFYVKEINYTQSRVDYLWLPTMRLVDASINNDTCSFPNSSIYTLGIDYHLLYWPINYMSCPHPLKNSSLFTETTPCQTPNSRFTYIKVGHINASEVSETCRVDMVAWTSWRGFKDFKNASLEEINTALLYGFEIGIRPRDKNFSKWAILLDSLVERLYLPFLILLPIAVVLGAAISPVMAIIGFIVVLVFILSSYSRHFQTRILWWNSFDPLYVYAGRSSFI